MKKFLLVTVAALPLLAVGMNPASSQDIKERGKAGVSQSQGPAKEAQGKAQGVAKMNESSGARLNQSSGAQGRAEQARGEQGKIEQGRTEGRAVRGREGNAVVTGRDQGKDHGNSAALKQAQTQARTQIKDRTNGQAAGERIRPEPNAGANNRLSEDRSKGNKADEKGTKGPQNDPARTNRQATRPNQENDRLRQGTERVQQIGQAERRGGEAGGRVTLNAEQRTRIERTVLSGRDVPRVERVNFTVDVGAVVPSEVRFARVPETLVEINPGWRDDEYFVVRDEIVICDHSRRVVAMVPLGPSSASYETGSRSTIDVGDIDIRRVQEVLIERGYYHGPVDGVLGAETRHALIRFQEREGIEARGVIDERTYVALGIRTGLGRAEGRIERRTDAHVEGRSTEGRALQTEEKGQLVQKKGRFEPKRGQSSISGQAHSASKSSEPSHVNAVRELDKGGPSNRPSASGHDEKSHAVGEIKSSGPQGGTVGQSTRAQSQSLSAGKAGGASEHQSKHD
jgi:peptidoglycan hydrolase-like protein with peptidoglycan-binding domain